MISSTDTIECNDIIEANRRKFWILLYCILGHGLLCEAIAIRQRRWKNPSSSFLLAFIAVHGFATLTALLLHYFPDNCPHGCTCTGPDRSYLVGILAYPFGFWQVSFYYRGYAWMKLKEEAKQTTDAVTDASKTIVAIADGNFQQLD